MPLAPEECEQFLAEPHIGALSVSAGPDRGPLTVPIWYQYEPGGELWVLTGHESEKMRRISAAGRFALMVNRVEPTVRYVSVEGPVTRVEPGRDDRQRELAERYLPADQVEGYLSYATADLASHAMVFLRPQHWRSADLG